eukprot:PhM_4_TR6876/c0_g1_i1/m.31429
MTYSSSSFSHHALVIFLLILIAVVCISTAASAAPTTAIKADASTTSTAYRIAPYDEFGADRHCPACLLFATRLYQHMFSHDAPTTATDAQRKQFRAREDRIDEVIEDAISEALKLYIYVHKPLTPALRKSLKIKKSSPLTHVGRYWLIKDLIDSEMITPSAAHDAVSHNYNIKTFIWDKIINPHEEEIERIVAETPSLTTKLVGAICVEWAKVCAEDVAKVLTDEFPMDLTTSELQKHKMSVNRIIPNEDNGEDKKMKKDKKGKNKDNINNKKKKPVVAPDDDWDSDEDIVGDDDEI